MSSKNYSDDEIENEENIHPKKKFKNLNKNKDDESSELEEYHDSSEEDENEPNQYQYDDFVVGGDDDERRKRKKKEKRKKSSSNSDNEDDNEEEEEEDRGGGGGSGSGGSGGSGGRNSSSPKRTNNHLDEDIDGDEDGDDGSDGSESESESEEDEEVAQARRERRRKRREERRKREKGGLQRLKKLRASNKDLSDKEDDVEDGYNGEQEDDGFVVDSHGKPVKRSHERERMSYESSNRSRIMSDIFDDDEEEGYGSGEEEEDSGINKTEADRAKDRLAAIREQYEPSLLEEKHFTDADEEIRNKNVPERLQSRKGTQYAGEMACEEEAEWIYEVAFEQRDFQQQQQRNPNTEPVRDAKAITAIFKILQFIQRDLLEIPFIYTYEKDIYEPYFTLQELWNIFDLDEKWAHMKVNKRNLEQIGSNNQQLEPYKSVLLESRSEESISDLYDLFQMINGIQKNTNLLNGSSSLGSGGDGYDDKEGGSSATQGNTVGGLSRQKKAIKRDLYTIYTKAGLSKFLPNFGMTAQEFGQNLMDNYTTNKPRDQMAEPSTMALVHICLEADNKDRVLQATRYMMAQEIGYDPHVRYSVRMIYRKYAHITTTPTLKGFKEIDVFHPYFTVKSIQEKPAHLFEDSQYLLILKAEKEGFIKSTMAITEKTHNSVIIPEMESLYLSDGTSAITQQWNEQRKLIIREALNKFLYPVLEKELRNKLLTEASNRVAFECAKKLEDKIRVAPWRPVSSSSGIGHSNSSVLFGGSRANNGYSNDDDEDEDDDEEVDYDRDGNPIPFKILSLCWGSDKIPTMGAVLNSDGEVLSHIKLDFICDRLGESLKEKKEKDIKRLEEICQEYQPRLVLVSATEMDSKRLYEEVKDHLQRWSNGERRIIRKSVLLNYYSPEIGLSLQTSSRLQEEFKEYPPILRHTIAVGRCALDPITEYASLCNDHNEILFLKLHPLQDMIGKDYLVKLLHRCFINVVNAVGVDINRMIQCRFTSATLQFVSGLGSRKAQMLLNSLFRRGGFVTSRQSLEKVLSQDVIYRNCIGFIQIRERHAADYKADLLDDTRIHPTSYPITYRIAAEALDKNLDERNFHSYIEDIIKRPKKLDRLDLDGFADIIESHEDRPARKLLYFIKKELTNPFADIRHPYEEPSADTIFEWLTGETNQSLRRGTLVTVTTIRTFDNSVKCRLDNGLEGSIPTDCISDNGETKSLGRGVTINCRVMGVDKYQFTVSLSCKPSDLNPSFWEETIFRELKENGANQYLRLEEVAPPVEQTKRKPKRERRIKRTVVHPLWHDFSCLEAETYLSDKPIGDVLLRPSSKGHDHITATFKFADSIFLHHDIKEADKPNAVSLGKSFYMGDVKYDSLDEILARHVEYLINNLNEVKSNTAHWKDGNRSDVDDLIREEKKKNPKTIPYYFGYDFEHPGFLTLYHVPSNTPRHEPVLVKADGFILRKKLYPTYYELIKYFKRNYAQLLQPGSSSSSSSGSSSNNNNNNTSNQRLPSNTSSRSVSNNNNNNIKNSSNNSNNNSNNNNNMSQQRSQHQQFQQSTQQPPQRPQHQQQQPNQYQQQQPNQYQQPPPQSVYQQQPQPNQPYGQMPQQQPYSQGRPPYQQPPQQQQQQQQPYQQQPPQQQQPQQQQQQYNPYQQQQPPQRPQSWNDNQYQQQQPQQYQQRPPQQQPYGQMPPQQQYQQQQQYNRPPNQWGPPQQQQQGPYGQQQQPYGQMPQQPQQQQQFNRPPNQPWNVPPQQQNQWGQNNNNNSSWD
ncbi:SH2 domain-containing protein [Dictyostelium discoideum AX4]|uniref:SH2 domain-containing protein n=1 Tax=Dictyostelium discoideum TaxID=44689 RepID=Q55A48_DICDI|nr:SH2 domain-containing protein [Dictyostelium discoideum AX4]EAL71329.1 SH2 domain-containing protein [Dictyostelium discoideum AX4]|eukprot:XP_645136.1 SH2 domain-containing protein [Dictyostelium discoideum AX4]